MACSCVPVVGGVNMCQECQDTLAEITGVSEPIINPVSGSDYVALTDVIDEWLEEAA